MNAIEFQQAQLATGKKDLEMWRSIFKNNSNVRYPSKDEELKQDKLKRDIIENEVTYES